MPPPVPIQGGGWRVTAGDSFIWQYIASAAPTNLDMMWYVEYDDGQKAFFPTPQGTFTTDRTVQTGASTAASPIQKSGWLRHAAITGPDFGTLKRGQFYVLAFIDRPGTPSWPVGFGYAYSAHPFVAGRFVEPGPGGGGGYINTVTGTNPAAGAEVLETVPANALWRLLSFSVVLVTDANVADRDPNFIADDGTTANRRWMRKALRQTASLTRTHLWTPGTDVNVLSGDTAGTAEVDTDSILRRACIPEHPDDRTLPEGYRLRTTTDSIQATDNYAAPIFQVEEWLVL